MLLSQAPFAIVFLTVAIYGVRTIGRVSEKAEAILADNLRSVIAAQRMERSVDDVDGVLLEGLRGGDAPVDSLTAALERFESELVVQEHNITEEGEAEATADLRAAATRWRGGVLDAVKVPKGDRSRDYFEHVRPLAAEVKRHTTRVLEINQDAMVHKSTVASHFSKEVVQTLSYVSLFALLLAIATSFVLSDQIARPLVRLALGARQISEGNLEVMKPEAGSGSGEIDTLVREFSRMADRVGTYRKSSLGELIEATESAQAAIDSLVDPVLAFNADRSFRRANAAARAVLGLDQNAADPLATLSGEVRTKVASVRDIVLQGRQPPKARGFEDALAVLVDGKPHYLQPVATPIRAEHSGTVVGVTVLLRDVTQLRRADELKNDLLSTVAHEIRTPLTSIRMALHLCLERAIGPLTEKQEEILATARDDAERLHGIVEGILSAARIEAGALVGRRRRVTPRELVAKATLDYRIPASDKRVTLETAVEDGPVIEVDEESVVLVLANMLSNALKHTPTGGKITVAAGPLDGQVRFEVADTGTGIPAEYQPHLFEKFYRVPGSPPGGTGLGLAIARDIVFAHDGEIGVESEVGKGSRFWFRLPASVS